jgi:hypothetical protein
VLFVSGLLADHRREIGTRHGTRTISAAVPTAGFSSLTADDRRWIAESTGLRQISSRLQLSPVSVEITQDMLSDLDDRADGVALLAEALANDHETCRFRELARFFERAFRAAPTGIVGPLSDFLRYFDKLQRGSPSNRSSHEMPGTGPTGVRLSAGRDGRGCDLR